MNECSLESGVPWSQGLDLSLLLPVIGLIFTVVSKLLLLYSTIDKTSMLKMKSFSTMRVTQRGSQLYMEKRRGRRELEVEPKAPCNNSIFSPVAFASADAPSWVSVLSI